MAGMSQPQHGPEQGQRHKPGQVADSGGACLRGAGSGSNGIWRQRQQDLDLRGRAALLELAARLHQVVCAAPAVLLHKALHPDEWLHIVAQPVGPASQLAHLSHQCK